MFKKTVYALMVLFGLVAAYSLLTAGHPESLLRRLFTNPAHDVYLAVGSSFVVFVLGFFVFQTRDQSNFRRLVEMNGERVRERRRKGDTDQQIADSILAAMGSHSGYRHNLARKKLILLLSQYR